MLCMARCSSQSTVLTSWVSHWPQMPPGRHINITNKASRTLGSGKNPEDRLLFSKRQGLQVRSSCHTNPGICKLYLAPKQHQADQPPRVCTAKGSMVDTTEMLQDVNNMLTTLGWPYLQHRCRKARLVNTRWLSQYHKSPSFPFPVIPSAHLSSVVLTTGSSFSPTQSRIEMTSLRMWLLHPPLRLFVHVFQNLWSRPCPQVSSVGDG